MCWPVSLHLGRANGPRCTEGSCGDRNSGEEVIPLPLSPGQLVMAGVRALDPAEDTFLQAERVPVLSPSQLIRHSEASRTMHGGSDLAESAVLIGECSCMQRHRAFATTI